MVLIVESGSTKADWIILKDDFVHHSFVTEGLNPFSNKNSYHIIAETANSLEDSSGIEEVHFYGAGVVDEDIADKITQSFKNIPNASIYVNDDLLAAARATCIDEPGVVCILGTGSNIGFYDGEKITDKVASGGYLLGGEGSGMALGKEVLIRLLRNQLSQDSISAIKKDHNVDQSNITQILYSQSVPNRYMASFAPVIHKLSSAEKKSITDKVFTNFLEERILKLKASREFPIHFVGSISLSFQAEIEHMLKINNLAVGKIVDKPIHNLVQYHKRTN